MGCSPPSDGHEQRWADSSQVGQHLCPDVHRHPAPGSPPFVPSFRSWGDQGGQCPSPRAASALRLPTLGVLGEVRGRALEPLFTQGQAPESRDQSPLAVVTQDVCARACKCGCMCVRSLRISLGIFRVGLEEVGNRRMSSSVSSGGRNQEARPTGP